MAKRIRGVYQLVVLAGGAALGLFLSPTPPVAWDYSRGGTYSLAAVPLASTFSEKERAAKLKTKLSRAISERYPSSKQSAPRYAATFVKMAKTLNTDPFLYAAIAGVESSYIPRAQSGYGAVGLMQVVPRFHAQRYAEKGLSIHHPTENIVVGAHILAGYLDTEKGDMARALQRYNGSIYDKDRRYTNRVLNEYAILVSKAPRQIVISKG